jgi:ribosomal protein L11 methylase PrmA
LNATLESAGLVIANLTGALLQRHALALRRLVASNGVLIVSGFTVEEEQDVARAFGAPPGETAREGDWIALKIP